MDNVLRFILRLLLVPIGACAAMLIATIVIVVAHFGDFIGLMKAHPDVGYWLLDGLVVVATLAMLLSFAVLPAIVGVLIAEALAIRSWIFHVANGGLSALVGRLVLMTGDWSPEYRFLYDPMAIIAAGLAAGGAYWLVAGWTAGFWKPIFTPAPATVPTPVP
jgi:hypothetical protein